MLAHTFHTTTYLIEEPWNNRSKCYVPYSRYDAGWNTYRVGPINL